MRHMVFIVVLLWGALLQAASPGHWFEKPKSPRLANYKMEAVLDWPSKTLTGQMTLSWKNNGTAPTQELPLHLYMNAFKGPDSLFLAGHAQPDPRDASAWGYCRLLNVALGGQKLDGHRGADDTVWWVSLPKAVAPGETVNLQIDWETRFPRAFGRSCWSGYFLMVAQWFPKVGVYQGGRWICHPYHPLGEFFADFGTYDLQLSLPNLLLPAHTGVTIPQGPYDARPDPKRKFHNLYTIHAEDVHDFAFAVMPDNAWKMVKHVYRGIEVYTYYQKEHFHAVARMQHAVNGALRALSEWAAPYPYPTLTVVDVPDDAPSAAGMEYPTLVTISAKAFDPLRLRTEPEEVAIHEVSHQIFQGVLASNEVEHPWLDEGLTSWFTARTLERLYGNLLATRRFQIDPTFPAWWSHASARDPLPMTWAAHQYRDWSSLNASVYAKPTLVLNQLEALLGRPVMEEAIRAYVAEMAFQHPTPADLKRILERVSQRDLTAFWRDHVEGTETLDYVIGGVHSWDTLQGGWKEQGGKLSFTPPVPLAPGRQGAITLVRRGGLVTPITLWVRLEDKTEQRLTWDGKDRSITYTFPCPVVGAVLDPDGNYPLLRNRLESSYTATPARRGLHYWAQMAWGLLTGMLQGVGIG